MLENFQKLTNWKNLCILQYFSLCLDFFGWVVELNSGRSEKCSISILSMNSKNCWNEYLFQKISRIFILQHKLTSMAWLFLYSYQKTIKATFNSSGDFMIFANFKKLSFVQHFEIFLHFLFVFKKLCHVVSDVWRCQ